MLLRSGPPGATSALVLRRMRPVVGGTYEVLEKLRDRLVGRVVAVVYPFNEFESFSRVAYK